MLAAIIAGWRIVRQRLFRPFCGIAADIERERASRHRRQSRSLRSGCRAFAGRGGRLSDMNAEKRNDQHQQHERPIPHQPFREFGIDPGHPRRIGRGTPRLDMMSEEKERARGRAAMGEGFGHGDVIGLCSHNRQGLSCEILCVFRRSGEARSFALQNPVSIPREY